MTRGAAEAATERVRVCVYDALARTGSPPRRSELAERSGVPVSGVVTALRRLHDDRMLVLDEDDEVVLAHPFATVNLGFSVMGARTLWWGGCAWDSFAIPHLVPHEPSVLVATSCPACGSALAWRVTTDHPPAGPELAHFLVPTDHIWDDVVHSCRHQMLFCDEACIDAWLTREGHARGAVLDLATLWRLARHWYDGRLSPGYRRREPEESKEYFASVGLGGSFWGAEKHPSPDTSEGPHDRE